MDQTSINPKPLHTNCDRSSTDITGINHTECEKINDLQVSCSPDESFDRLPQSSATFLFESWRFIFNELITRNRQLNEKIDQCLNYTNDQLNAVEVRINDIHSENEQMKKRFDEQIIRCNEFHNHNQSLKNQHQQDNQPCARQLEEINNSLNTCIIQLNVRLNNNEIQMKRFEDENRQMRRQVDLCLTQLNDQARKNEELQIEIKQLKEQTIKYNTHANNFETDSKDQKMTVVQNHEIDHMETKNTSKTNVSFVQSDDETMDYELIESIRIPKEFQCDKNKSSAEMKTDSESIVTKIQIRSDETSNTGSITSDSSTIQDDEQQEITQDQNSTLEEKIRLCDDRSTVDLRRQGLTDQDMEIVVQEAMINKQCKHLWLDSNKITSIGTWLLAHALNSNNTLQQLSLTDNDISDDGVHFLFQILSINNNTLKVLHLENNRITDEGMEYLAEMIKTNTTLTHLYLQKNDISDQGVQILANAIENYNSTIEDLSLYSNKLLTDMSVDYLLQMIRNHQSLKKLYVFDCDFSETGKKRLIKAQQLKTNFKVYVNSLNDY